MRIYSRKFVRQDQNDCFTVFRIVAADFPPEAVILFLTRKNDLTEYFPVYFFNPRGFQGRFVLIRRFIVYPREYFIQSHICSSFSKTEKPRRPLRFCIYLYAKVIRAILRAVS